MRTDFITTAIVVTLDVALFATPERAVNAKDICARHGWTHRNCEGMLQALVRGGVLAGHRGPTGGYRLAPGAWSKTLAEVGKLAIRTSRATAKGEKTKDAAAALHFVELAEHAYWAELGRVTIEEAAAYEAESVARHILERGDNGERV